jgi:catecholate siderophore receptor
MEFVPGVTMGQGEGHRDAPTIRGQSTTADFFVDGMRDDAQYYRDLYNVDQLEAIRGPSAATFGRGGGGGVINRVIKRPVWSPVRDLRLETGSWGARRTTLDYGQAFHARLAGRLNALYEGGDSFRYRTRFERFGVNPTISVAMGRTLLTAGVEHFTDHRTVDRGIPSATGRPAVVDRQQFIGDPAASRASLAATMLALQTLFDNGHGLTIRTHTRAADYDKAYRNVFANSAVYASNPRDQRTPGPWVNLGAYDDHRDRRSLFHQSDLLWHRTTRWGRQLTLVGAELSTQRTDATRLTGYFDDGSPTRAVALAAPTVELPVSYRPGGMDSDLRGVADGAALHVQQQLWFGSHLQLIAGVRHDRMDVRVANPRSQTTVARRDPLWSPRLALVVTPAPAVALYASTTRSALPSSGEQLLGLTPTNRALQPEQFENREFGVKWSPAATLDVTAAWFHLTRSNMIAPDPTDARRVVQTGAQRTAGGEVGIQGTLRPGWELAAAFAHVDARLVAATSAAPAGASVPLVPRITASLWNKLQLTKALAIALGLVHQGDRYAALDNSVTLPAFQRLDATAYLRLPRSVALQLQIENLRNSVYTATSHGNNNIMPGAPRTVRLALTVHP